MASESQSKKTTQSLCSTSVSNPDEPLQFGDRIGQYVVTGFAGKGATSFVYRARRTDSFEPVAIKVLHNHLVSDPVKRRQFYREARIMMRMNHPNVVRFHEIIEDRGYLAFVMEYVDGVTLEQWHKQGPYEESTIASVFVDILRGVGFAHRQAVVHRDLKPANVLISYEDEQYVAKIIDFGVARFCEQPVAEDEQKKIVGTAAYISPEEVFCPERVGPSSDLYSLGVMLYEAVCGRRPFEGLAVKDLLKAHAMVHPSRPRRVNPGLSASLEQVIMRTLDKAPETRFTSAFDMIDALERAIHAPDSLSESACELRASSVQDTEESLTIAWSRNDLEVQQRKASSGLMRRCMNVAFTLFTSTGATGNLTDPHHLNRYDDVRFPFN